MFGKSLWRKKQKRFLSLGKPLRGSELFCLLSGGLGNQSWSDYKGKYVGFEKGYASQNYPIFTN